MTTKTNNVRVDAGLLPAGRNPPAPEGSVKPAPPPNPPKAREVEAMQAEVGLSHADLCRLFSVFNDHNELHLPQDQRISEWLIKRIANFTGERNG